MYNLQLETFIVVADLESFNKAAETLYITPPAVTKQINLLKKDLGLTLFVRTHRGLALTEAGKSLYKIDIVAGIFDETMLKLRQCAGMEIGRQQICCAVSVNHRLAEKEMLTFQDLYGENPLMMRRGWSNYVDELGDEIWKNHPQIRVVDFDIYSVDIFNQCENSNDILMAVENWKDVHPLLKVIPVEWKYTIPYGVLYSPEPSKLVRRFLEGIKKAI